MRAADLLKRVLEEKTKADGELAVPPYDDMGTPDNHVNGKNLKTVKDPKKGLDKKRDEYPTADVGSARQENKQFRHINAQPKKVSEAKGRRELSVPQRHQLKIARDTLKMSDAGAKIMGGMTKEEARDIIKRFTGKDAKEQVGEQADVHPVIQYLRLKIDPNTGYMEFHAPRGSGESYKLPWAGDVKALVTKVIMSPESRQDAPRAATELYARLARNPKVEPLKVRTSFQGGRVGGQDTGAAQRRAAGGGGKQITVGPNAGAGLSLTPKEGVGEDMDLMKRLSPEQRLAMKLRAMKKAGHKGRFSGEKSKFDTSDRGRVTMNLPQRGPRKENVGEAAHKPAAGEMGKAEYSHQSDTVSKSASVRTKQNDAPTNKGNPGTVKKKEKRSKDASGRMDANPVKVAKMKARGQISELEDLLGTKLNLIFEAKKKLTEEDLAQDPVDAYWQTALWSSNDESDETGGEPMDQNYGPEDIDPESYEQGAKEVQQFIQMAQKQGLLIDPQAESLAHVAHDFWLTRNGHGAGFWGGDYPQAGDALTALSKKFGEVDLYVGDDGKIYNYGGGKVVEQGGHEYDDDYRDEQEAQRQQAMGHNYDEGPADDEEEDFDLKGEMETGIVIGDAGMRGGYNLSAEGKFIDEFTEMDDALQAAEKWMNQHKYWPNVFYVNDHGNVSLIDTKGKIHRSWV